MLSAQPAKDEPDHKASMTPIGVRRSAVVSARWVVAALAGALGLGTAVFFLFPAWLSPPRAPAPPAVAVSKPAAPPPIHKADPAEDVRQRLAAEEAAARYREQESELAHRDAGTWAPDDWAAALAAAKEAAAAVAGRDYAGAIEHYEDASRRLTGISEQAGVAFTKALAAGNAAIDARNSETAIKAFQLALAIRPGDEHAKRGLGRAQRLDDVLARVAAGEARESAGDLRSARQEYAAAVKLDPAYKAAAAALARIDRRLAAQRFDQLMSQGLTQLQGSDWAAAEQSFHSALKLRPNHPSAADGLARAKEGLQRETLARLEREGRALESAERWKEAQAVYRRAAAIDPAIDFAREGVARSSRMIALEARIANYLAEPERLYSRPVREEARGFLAALNNETAGGARLAEAKRRLQAALVRAATKITVRLTSDNATAVTLYRVGRLGRFRKRELTLTPGTYTLVGSRPGYKDVRRELVVAPDSEPPRVYIACEERV